MWTEAHRARYDARLKEIVSLNAVAEVARWLERVAPPRSGRATPYGAVVRAIAWHLRVGGPSRGGGGGPHRPASGRTAPAPAICETNRIRCARAARLAAAPAMGRRCAGAKRWHARPAHKVWPARYAAGLLAPAIAPPARRRSTTQSLSGARHAAPGAPRSTSFPSVKPRSSLRDQIGIRHTGPLKQALRRMRTCRSVT